MGHPIEPPPARLFMSLIVRDGGVLRHGLEELKTLFGETDFVSNTFPFHYTDYYTPEMGTGLFRHFVTFAPLFPIPHLPETKRMTNDLEGRLADREGKRRINIDPGYLCLQHVVLATTKGYTHRPYLRDGIYADLTLIYRDHSYRPLEWTYPDYREEAVIRLLNHLRKQYKEALKQGDDKTC